VKARLVWSVAVADFRERVRRPAYLVILAAGAGLAYLAIPTPESHQVTMDAGGYRGLYNSAFVGTVAALVGATCFSLAGFYIVRYAIARDERTGVGQLLAATPMPTVVYFAGKFLSNLMVLASMTAVLAVAAAVLQLARGEATSIAPVALLTPFLLLTLPVVILTAAAALLFDALPVLRKGLGNIAWFFIWLFATLSSIDLLGVQRFMVSIRAALAREGVQVRATDISFGLIPVRHPLKTFVWTGMDPSSRFVVGRLLLVLIAVGLAILPSLWFGRFDPARGPRGTRRWRLRASKHRFTGVRALRPSGESAVDTRPRSSGRPRAAVRRGNTLARLFVGECRVLAQGVSLWWWAGLALLSIISLTASLSGLRAALLVDWIWPTLIWSRLGTQRHESGLDGLLASYPSRFIRLGMEWAAGVALAALAAVGPLIRLASAGEWWSVFAVLAGALLIPSLALSLGEASHTQRLFQAVYVPLWYLALNGVTIVGVVVITAGARRPERSIMVAALALAMLAATFLLEAIRDATR
jgi:hypothetical protein